MNCFVQTYAKNVPRVCALLKFFTVINGWFSPFYFISFLWCVCVCSLQAIRCLWFIFESGKQRLVSQRYPVARIVFRLLPTNKSSTTKRVLCVWRVTFFIHCRRFIYYSRPHFWCKLVTTGILRFATDVCQSATFVCNGYFSVGQIDKLRAQRNIVCTAPQRNQMLKWCEKMHCKMYFSVERCDQYQNQLQHP